MHTTTNEQQGERGEPMKVLALIIALALLVTPLTAAAPPPGTVHRIGFLWNASPALTRHLLDAFQHGLHERGYVEGTHFTIENRYAEGDPARLPGLAAELVGLQVAVIVTAGSQAIQAVKQATSTIPVVIAASSDPVETGFVTSLARPGENLTGLSLSAPELSGKRLELLKEAVPAIAHVAVLANPANPSTDAQLRETQRAAQALQVQLHPVEVRGPQELDQAFSAIRSVPADALLVLLDPLFMQQRARLVELTAANRLPAMYSLREDVEMGALMAYGPSFPDMFRRAATYVDKILKGARPATLPVEQPTKYELVLNLKTAQALGITLPPTLLILADEVMR
jgi:putative tryptophan/tyrosine transport system substrate-binding protein